MSGAKSSKFKSRRKFRCAIYTRKSSEEGLEQDFNSLDAQREACESYVQSQRHEGWKAIRASYDDGGYSSGTMERPGLKALIADVHAGKIDVVVVYKVDRLTRALSDFAKIVDVFDAHEVSFVSVTQAFNTTTSMGRLTLNVLLSFAQFEREVTGERIRDKIAASKKKGMWMGGLPPLGYDVMDRSLLPNEAEARSVTHIFKRYLALGSVRLLAQELETEGIMSKARTNKDGTSYGARPLARGALYLMLQNRIYLGEIKHKDQHYPGLHSAIVGLELWDKVQERLEQNRKARTSGTDHKEPSLLAGLIFDAEGKPLTPTHASKQGKRYRYYVSQALLTKTRDDTPHGVRIPAAAIEPLVTQRISEFFNDGQKLIDAAQASGLEPSLQKHIISRGRTIAGLFKRGTLSDRREAILALTLRIQVHKTQIQIDVVLASLCMLLNLPKPNTSSEVITLTIEAELKRAGIGKRLILTDGLEVPEPDEALIALVLRAIRIRDRLLGDTTLSLKEIAAEEGVVSSYITRLLRIGFLAPSIIEAILEGKEPPGLTASSLAHIKHLPASWDEQRTHLGL
ncbi:recombinase family protein [bacterium AH-315-P15]|nr:recombinase family protein [bacterium AH-315-P15]